MVCHLSLSMLHGRWLWLKCLPLCGLLLHTFSPQLFLWVGKECAPGEKTRAREIGTRYLQVGGPALTHGSPLSCACMHVQRRHSTPCVLASRAS